MQATAAFTFERTEDLDLVRSILTNAAVYSGARDDFSPAPENFEVPESGVVWVLAKHDEELLGLWALWPHSHILYEVHTCLLPTAWGSDAAAAAIEFLEWVWDHTPCLRLITSVPDFNRTALAFARRGGLTEWGLNPRAFMKRGKLWDVHMLGISSPRISRVKEAA